MAKLGLLERLAEGPVICAEGYLFELERRGYLQAGAYVPEFSRGQELVQYLAQLEGQEYAVVDGAGNASRRIGARRRGVEQPACGPPASAERDGCNG